MSSVPNKSAKFTLTLNFAPKILQLVEDAIMNYIGSTTNKIESLGSQSKDARIKHCK